MDTSTIAVPSEERERTELTRARLEEVIHWQIRVREYEALNQPAGEIDDSYPISIASPDRLKKAQQELVVALSALVTHGEAQALPRKEATQAPRSSDRAWEYLGESTKTRYFLDPTYQVMWQQICKDFGADECDWSSPRPQ
ncbi:hypothetical protein HY524_00860 [Candidatus Berkelbacteria bacterium]|nr:hypothetical protein [Candidatus Berkelbacteria bacterium]